MKTELPFLSFVQLKFMAASATAQINWYKWQKLLEPFVLDIVMIIQSILLLFFLVLVHIAADKCDSSLKIYEDKLNKVKVQNAMHSLDQPSTTTCIQAYGCFTAKW